MKKYLIVIFLFLLISCRNEEDPIYIPETVKIIETVTIEVTKVIEKEKTVFLSATYDPQPTWTATPTPFPGPTWTPTPEPIPQATWTPTPTPTPAPTWTPTPIPTPTSVGWEFYLDGILVTPTPTPAPTWTPTPTPTPVSTWTPTPTPTSLPPEDLGYVKTSIVSSYNFSRFGESVTIGIPAEKSPIVDHNSNNDLFDGITISDDQNYFILSIKENKNSNTEIVLLSLTPVNAPVTITFWTTRK